MGDVMTSLRRYKRGWSPLVAGVHRAPNLLLNKAARSREFGAKPMKKCVDPCPGSCTPRDEYWRGVHPSNIHRVRLYPLLEGRIPVAPNIGGVYTLVMFIACAYTPCREVYAPRDSQHIFFV